MPINPIRLDLEAFNYLGNKRFWVDLWKEIQRDDCWGMAARLSFYFILAFFPFLIFISALIGFVPVDPDLLSKILLEMETFLPEKTYTWVRDFTIDLVNSQDSGVVSIGILLALWWASTAFRGMIWSPQSGFGDFRNSSLPQGAPAGHRCDHSGIDFRHHLGGSSFSRRLAHPTADAEHNSRPLSLLSGPLARHLLCQSLDLAFWLPQRRNANSLLLPSSSTSGVDAGLTGKRDCQFLLDPGIEKLCIFRQSIGGL